MNEPTRSQRIIRIVEAASQPLTLAEIIQRLGGFIRPSQYNTIAAQVSLHVKNGLLQRVGVTKHYRYAKPASQPDPHACPVAPTLVTRQTYITEAPRERARTESVDDFIARGGNIQRLAAGEVSQPICNDLRKNDLQRMRERDHQRKHRDDFIAENDEDADSETAAA